MTLASSIWAWRLSLWGNGLFKANPSSLLSTCYAKDDPRLDGAFTMYYMSVNIGSFFSMLATPWLAARYGWSTAFALSVVGMLITVVNFAFCQRWVKSYGSKPDFEPINFRNLLLTIVGIVVLIAVATLAAAQPGYRAYGAGRNRSWHRHYLR
ncbi:proton/oligopeptide symporter [Salmonella enterica subsp. enterica]|uniref:Proton/oligopeptide symporter n=1 Tax=Salmonella enterica I TaxID=59201 RepID=A0A379WUL6_SALET|nr:proton/oligopeptide symporter [Salmonella enterica subsp. enterica]